MPSLSLLPSTPLLAPLSQFQSLSPTLSQYSASNGEGGVQTANGVAQRIANKVVNSKSE